MSRLGKILLGIATAWPFAYIVMFVMFILLMIGTDPGGGDPNSSFGIFFLILFAFHMITMLLILGLQIFYIVHAVKNEDLSQNGKIGWILGLFLAGLFAMPVYWYLNIWKMPDEDSAGYIGSGSDFETEADFEWENRQKEYVPREPHSWK